jgi:hypothetical protein
MRDASPENTLDLTFWFNGRLLAPDTSWLDLEPLITDFLKGILAKEPVMRLFLEAHAPIATLAGARLGFKSGADVEVVQRGQNNPGIIWSATDGAGGPEPTIEAEVIGEGRDVAVAVGLTHDTAGDVRGYVANNLTDVGTLLRVTPASGPGQDAIRGGEHAATMAGAIAKAVIAARTPGSTVHLFVAGPNAFAFFLGQQAEAMGKCIPYEFDFGGRTDGTYRPTFTI